MLALPDDALKGSYPPLVTPFTAAGAVDEADYAAIVEFHVREGSHGITVCGTTGEPSVLTTAERKRCASIAMDVAAGRLPVIVATGSQSLAETLELTTHAESVGAAAALVVTPYYIRPNPRGLIAYYGEVCRSTRLPVLVYHIPGRAAVGVSVETLVEICSENENLVGMKHAVHELSLVTDAIERLGPEFRIHVGLEELSFPMLALGATGLMNAVGNVWPAKVAELYEVVAKADLEAGRRIHRELWDLNKSIFFDSNPIPVKYMMRRLGIIRANHHRLPLQSATADIEARCDRVLAAAGLLL
jgi:4-hydroxy-tetrahydrodipicolinate synthase